MRIGGITVTAPTPSSAVTICQYCETARRGTTPSMFVLNASPSNVIGITFGDLITLPPRESTVGHSCGGFAASLPASFGFGFGGGGGGGVGAASTDASVSSVVAVSSPGGGGSRTVWVDGR